MDYGRYFRLDTDASDIGRGLAVFRYRPDGERDSLVYATITDSGMEFYMMGPETKGRVLYIPLDDNLDRNLAMTLADNFSSTIQVPEKTAYVKTMTAGSDRHGYFAIFNGNGKKPPQVPHPWACWADATKDDFPLGKLILDFLFDLQETRIFQMSPHYRRLSEKLHENFFSRALAAKAKYLYQRVLHKTAFKANSKPVQERDRKQRRGMKHFYGELFFEAEKEWTECIRDPRSDKTFRDANGWFDDSETEMLRIYKPWMAIQLDPKYDKEKKESDKLASQWLTSRYLGFTAWGIFLGGHRSFFGSHLFWPRPILSIAAVWFPLIILGQTTPLAFIPAGTDMTMPVTLLFVLTFLASLGVVKRVAPLVKGIPWRALKITGIVVLISFITGSLLVRSFGVAIGTAKFPSTTFYLFWGWSAFAGLVLQLILQRTNPAESI